MKRQHISILALLAFATPLTAQSTGFIGDLFQKTAPATSAPFNNSNPKYNSWTVMYSYVGSGNFSIELDCAPDATTPGGMPTPGAFITCTNTVTGSNPSTQALGNFGYITFVGYTPWLETKINSIASGSVTVIAVGFPPADPESGGGGGGGGCAGTTGTPCIVAGPNASGQVSTKDPVQVAGNDGTDVRNIATDTAGSTQTTGVCDSSRQPSLTTIAVVALTTSGLTQVIPATSGKAVVICSGTLTFASGVNFQFETGTGTNCGSGTAALTGILQSITGLSLDSTSSLLAPVSAAVCVNLGASIAGGGWITYAVH